MAEVLSSNLNEPILRIPKDILEEYLDILRLSGVTERHIKEVKRTLKKYKKYILSVVEKQRSIQFFSKLQKESSVSYYRKQMYQLIRFLKFLKVEWADEISLPKEPKYTPKRITKSDIGEVLTHFKDKVRIKTLVLLGTSSGCRALELYRLSLEDIDLNNRKIYIRSENSKTKRSRVTFFSEETLKSLKKYIDTKPNRLFPQKSCERAFYGLNIKVKDLRKYFSQEWDRFNGPTSIKKLLMGHLLDTDLKHYNNQNETDLKKIYDKVMLNHRLE